MRDIAKGAELFAGACAAALAACLPAQARAQQASPFRPERFDETWPDEAVEPFGAAYKNIEIAPGVDISFGGDARWRVASINAPRLGLGGAEADVYALQRLLLHADLRFGDGARVFVQLGSHDGIDRQLPASTDDNRFAVQQAFLDLTAQAGAARANLRIGRQELVLGPRFATARDSVNVRQRHDMVRVFVTDGPWRIDVFGGRPVRDERGAFDDHADTSQDFFGARVQRLFGAVAADAYVYGLDREGVTLAGATADDDRLTVGVRVAGRRGAYDFDAEIARQSGAFGAQDIEAGALVLDIGRRFADAPFSPRLGARLTYGSGDRDPGDGVHETFAPPFPNGAWFGQNGLASFSNTLELAATLGLNPRTDVTINLKLAGVWRAAEADALYSGSTQLTATLGADDAYVGVAPALLLVWRPSENITISPYVSYLAASDELKLQGAGDVAYAHIGVSLRF